MPPAKLTYATVGGVTALLALVVDQLLWLRFPLYFALGIPLAFLTPFAAAGIGSLVGYWAMEEYGQKLGYAIVVTNLLAAILGIWWALELQPRAFGARDATPVFIAGVKSLIHSPGNEPLFGIAFFCRYRSAGDGPRIQRTSTPSNGATAGE